MANPLQPKCLKLLETKYNAIAINLVGASKAGYPDCVACIDGLFYGFEFKWKNDTPSTLQKEKINAIINAGGSAYFIRSVKQLQTILDNNIEPQYYDLGPRFNL